MVGGGGEEPVDKHFEVAIPPSCNYPANRLSVRSLPVNQFCTWTNQRKMSGVLLHLKTE